MKLFNSILVASCIFSSLQLLADSSEFKTLNTSDLQKELADEKINLQVFIGNALFFDKNLSLNKTMSCASCHDPSHGFSENKAISIGSEGKILKKHSPALVNMAWQNKFFWDGRADSLEQQALMPIIDKDEMNLPLNELVNRLNAIPSYVEAFQRAYGSTGIAPATIAKSIAAFEKSLISQNSPFDKYLGGEKTALNESQIRGMHLFSEKAKCIKCHSGENFHDNDFHNTGVIVSPGEKGRSSIDRVSRREFDVVPYPFFGANAAFKTPSLRNVELSPPYFHNGSEPNLEEVVKFYNRGGKSPDRSGRAKHIENLNLSESEIKDIVAFLKALTSEIKVTPVIAADILKNWNSTRGVASEIPQKK